MHFLFLYSLALAWWLGMGFWLQLYLVYIFHIWTHRAIKSTYYLSKRSINKWTDSFWYKVCLLEQTTEWDHAKVNDVIKIMLTIWFNNTVHVHRIQDGRNRIWMSTVIMPHFSLLESGWLLGWTYLIVSICADIIRISKYF